MENNELNLEELEDVSGGKLPSLTKNRAAI